MFCVDIFEWECDGRGGLESEASVSERVITA